MSTACGNCPQQRATVSRHLDRQQRRVSSQTCQRRLLVLPHASPEHTRLSDWLRIRRTIWRRNGSYGSSLRNQKPTGPAEVGSLDQALNDEGNLIRLLRCSDPHEEAYISSPVGDKRGTYCLSTWKRDEAPPYVAVSYTWGSSASSVTVNINEQKVQIRCNCWEALQQVQQHFPGDYYWIDSICINQSDDQEKAAQVVNMGETFNAAKVVVACVGPSDADATIVMKALQPPRALDPSTLGSQLQSALVLFAIRPYWQRLWIVQECGLARDLRILCGQWHADAAALHHLARSNPLYEEALHSGQSGANRFRLMASVLQYSLDRTPYIDFTEAIMLFGDRLCADPRDRVYGLRALIVGENQINVDYTMSVGLLAATVSKLCRTRASVVMLLQALDVVDDGRIHWPPRDSGGPMRPRVLSIGAPPIPLELHWTASSSLRSV